MGVVKAQVPIAAVVDGRLIFFLESALLHLHQALAGHREGGVIEHVGRVNAVQIKASQVLFQPVAIGVLLPL
ncbi:hypothetical protein D9M68_825130 [compost metagenome]